MITPRPLLRRRSSSPLSALLVAVALGVVACGGGTLRVSGVQPRPRVVVGPQAPRYSIDVSRVQDTVFTDRVTVREVQRSLYLGFQSAVGQKFAPQRGPDTITLVLDMVAGDMAHADRRVILMHYAGRWVAPTGEVITEFRGTAFPRDPDLYGKKNVEDVMGILLERCVGHLAEAQARAKAQQPQPQPQPTDVAPRLPPSAPPPDLRLPPNKPPGT